MQVVVIGTQRDLDPRCQFLLLRPPSDLLGPLLDQQGPTNSWVALVTQRPPGPSQTGWVPLRPPGPLQTLGCPLRNPRWPPQILGAHLQLPGPAMTGSGEGVGQTET